MKNDLPARLYRLAIQAYPPEFRARNSEEMLRVFGEGLSAIRDRGPGATTVYLVHIALDFVRTAFRERVAVIDGGFWLAAVVSGLFGLFTVYAERHAFPARSVMCALLISGAIIGSLHPRRTWPWAVVIVACVPFAHLLVGELHFGHRPFLRVVVVEAGITAVAGIAVLIGAFATVVLRPRFHD